MDSGTGAILAGRRYAGDRSHSRNGPPGMNKVSTTSPAPLNRQEWSADRRLRYHQLTRVLRDVAGNVAVLEVGAGPGNLRAWGWPARVTAADLSAHPGLSVRADAARLPFRD